MLNKNPTDSKHLNVSILDMASIVIYFCSQPNCLDFLHTSWEWLFVRQTASFKNALLTQDRVEQTSLILITSVKEAEKRKKEK